MKQKKSRNIEAAPLVTSSDDINVCCEYITSTFGGCYHFQGPGIPNPGPIQAMCLMILRAGCGLIAPPLGAMLRIDGPLAIPRGTKFGCDSHLPAGLYMVICVDFDNFIDDLGFVKKFWEIPPTNNTHDVVLLGIPKGKRGSQLFVFNAGFCPSSMLCMIDWRQCKKATKNEQLRLQKEFKKAQQMMKEAKYAG